MRTAIVMALSLFATPAFGEPGSSWNQALAAEAKQLEAEKAALERALKDAESSAKTARRALVGDIERLTAQLSKARAENATRSQRLPDAERAHSLEDQARQMKQTMDQIRAWTTTRKLDVEDSLVPMVDAALADVEKRGGLYVESTEYFGADGIAKEGKVLHVAEVAALVETDPPIPLVLVGDGSLRAARGVPRGDGPTGSGRVLGVVLFDPLESHTPQSYHETTWRDWMRRGGPIMWPIALLGLIGILVSLERFSKLVALHLRLPQVRGLVNRDEREALRAIADPILAPIVVAGTSSGSVAEAEAEAIDALLSAKPIVRRGVSFLGIVAAVSPLVGLLGTVTGMISTFTVITEHGTGDPRLLSAGISEALLTTQLGLTVAVPALLLHTALLRWGDVVLGRIENIALTALERRPRDE